MNEQPFKVSYEVKGVLLYWHMSKEDEAQLEEINEEYSDEEEEEPSRDRVNAYKEALELWSKKNGKHFATWLKVEWITFALFHKTCTQFLIEQHAPTTKGNVYNALCFRRAIFYSIRGVEKFRGELTHTMMEASTLLLARGYVGLDDIPEDLKERAGAATTRLEGMDEEDLAVAYCGGAHWMIHTFRTIESMVEPLKAIGFRLNMRPVITRL